MKKNYKKWEIILVDLNPVKGSEMAKIRPCLIISPNSVNNALNTLIVVPLTSTIKNYPSRLSINSKGRSGSLAFDQIKRLTKAES